MDFGPENIDIVCFSVSLTPLALLLSKLCKQQPVYQSQAFGFHKPHQAELYKDNQHLFLF